MVEAERIFVFECSSKTYMECIEKSVFGSNVGWPLEVKQGDYCLLHHYEVGSVFGLWQATTNGGKKLEPKAWGGRFPFQAKVELVSPDIIEVPRPVVVEFIENPETGHYDNAVAAQQTAGLMAAMRELT